MTLAVLDLHCATDVFPELFTLGISQPSGLQAAFRSAHEELEFSTIQKLLIAAPIDVAKELFQQAHSLAH